MRPAGETKPELPGAGAVTFLVLLLLVGAVNGGPEGPLRWAAADSVREEVVAAARVQPGRSEPREAIATAASTLRLTCSSVRRVLTIADRMLPAPRAPTGDRIS